MIIILIVILINLHNSAVYIFISSIFALSASFFLQVKLSSLGGKLKEKALNEDKLHKDIKNLESVIEMRTIKIDELNTKLEKMKTEFEEVSKKNREHRNELGHIVKERTTELEQMASEMSESQKALMYLVEDVNDSRNELEGLNKQLNKTLKDVQSSRDRIDAIIHSIARWFGRCRF